MQVRMGRPVNSANGNGAVRVHRVAGPQEKLAKTISLLNSKINQAPLDPRWRTIALAVIRAVPERDERGEINALAAYVKSRIKFRRDPYGVELIQDLSDSLASGAGDCDCYAVALGSLAVSIGYPVRLRIVGRDQYSHVYPEFYLRSRKEWYPVDLSRPRTQRNLGTPGAGKDLKVYIRRGDGKLPVQAQAQEQRAVVPGMTMTPPAGPDFSPEELSELGSWLSELGNKVFGKAAGKKLESSINAIGKQTLTAVKMIAPVIPGIGPLIGKGADIAIQMTHQGEDPTKMSWNAINEINVSNPQLAAQLAQIKQANTPGYAMTSRGVEYKGTYAYQDPNAPQVAQVYGDQAAAVQAVYNPGTGQYVQAAAGAVPQMYGPQAQAAKSSSIMPLLAIAGAVLAAKVL